jgi:hypothetical protein
MALAGGCCSTVVVGSLFFGFVTRPVAVRDAGGFLVKAFGRAVVVCVFVDVEAVWPVGAWIVGVAWLGWLVVC